MVFLTSLLLNDVNLTGLNYDVGLAGLVQVSDDVLVLRDCDNTGALKVVFSSLSKLAVTILTSISLQTVFVIVRLRSLRLQDSKSDTERQEYTIPYCDCDLCTQWAQLVGQMATNVSTSRSGTLGRPIFFY